MNIEELFLQEDKKIVATSRRISYADDILKKIEEDFKSLSTPTEEQKSRDKEKKKINMEIRKLKLDIKKYSNVKNHKRTTSNSIQHDKRETLRRQIILLEKRLKEIDMEDEAILKEKLHK